MSKLDSLLWAVRRRERVADAARGLARWALPASLFIAAAALLAIRLRGAPAAMLWLTAVPVPAIVGWALFRPRSMRATARRIDAHYGLQDQIGSAYELQRSAPRGVAGDDPRTGEIVALLSERADELARGLDPRPVVPLSVPPPRWLDGLAVLAVLGAALVPRPEAPTMDRWARQLDLPLQSLATRAGLDLALADPLRHSLHDLATDDEDAAAKAAQRMLEILEELETGELERAEAFEELEALEELLAEAEERFEAQLEEDPGMLADAMRDLAEALQEQELTAEAGEKFEKSRPEEAKEALDEAAEQAAENPADDEAMREAMEEAERRLKDAAKRSSDTAERLDEAERRLRREQKKEGGDPQEQERRLKKMKERVEELRRKHEREMAAQRRLEQLRRNAQDAAKRGQSGQQRKQNVQKLSRNAQQASRTARQASRMRQARDALEEAKTFVRRAGKQGEGANRRRKQFKRFSKAAKGQKGKDGKGKGNKGKTTLLIEGEVGEGPPKMLIQGDGQQGQGQDGQGQGQDGQGQGQGQGQQGQDGGQGLTPGGDGIGDGSVDPEGEDRSIETNKKDVHVRAREGRGVSRAEVIRQSSQEGFANESYRDVFTDYRSFAQSALDNEALPPAKRRTVQRYYQLIQPRD